MTPGGHWRSASAREPSATHQKIYREFPLPSRLCFLFPPASPPPSGKWVRSLSLAKSLPSLGDPESLPSKPTGTGAVTFAEWIFWGGFGVFAAVKIRGAWGIKDRIF